jgi:hypothetical protein
MHRRIKANNLKVGKRSYFGFVQGKCALANFIVFWRRLVITGMSLHNI